ncbi:MAG: cohesin domain-containing protein [Candidatus Bathyarchaeota archaeon]|nr:cohesin domain-containing protein [Candidatus Bathyarchaeota archaeon]
MRQQKRRILLLAGFALLFLLLFCAACAQTARTTVEVEPVHVTAIMDETFTVKIVINNVQNLYGVDVTLSWNNTVLQVISASHLLGIESHQNGVLHETTEAPIYIVEDNANQQIGTYHLLATSQNPAPAFSGSGTIAVVTFKVISVGHSELKLQTELADFPAEGEPANFIPHTDVGGSVDTVIPEFPTVFSVAILVCASTVIYIILVRKSGHITA